MSNANVQWEWEWECRCGSYGRTTRWPQPECLLCGPTWQGRYRQHVYDQSGNGFNMIGNWINKD